ncbi:tyrosyl-tRNA synthetase [Candidatus Blochmanniella pennsylvanica str. BPEN]|uniref:Tyrosine--tRNA ligase n=1 Tax=Blochmanniella pennsylvanica (strain BPEN) TaxID=291272 RepID=SYY_BLOPB|nr:tyrosine--tRNA ligase [Candidatus Blochmannia pennsylvanicus]Q492T7.1 RecName: Full=Tyrosine--tRNA ligase; AltName: Full=Tyrosyl-tRNA synthetase; Short=TyrRS [Candidatus Blochmannia pennsylvanicus str. BPEN]AAZ41006.1 tyrosyl-tRNA synthetase [Candidatus Blochmannia pennsylvanicus str. BPEN]UOY04223.1 tyrosine--tRNA ligase [Candidatus Blochmannia pennsylvanicus]
MNNKNIDIIQLLYERDLIAQITNQEALIKILKSKSITLYCGFDPTSDSLHIGHLVPLLCLRQFQIFGHRPIILLGGGTGLIGDPSFKDSERKLNLIETVQKWIEKIKYQVSLFVDFSHSQYSQACIVNNYDWLSSISLLTFLRDIGKFFSVNKMINKDAIKKRLQKNNYGISYTEFSYNLLQSYDFTYLHKNYNAILQIGGSDQWGNIISGIDLIHRIYKRTTYGLTMPLLTKSDNTKFGKTEKHTIWLDAKKTSPYTFYQYWINTSDEEVYRFLKFFTNIDVDAINTLKKEDKMKNTKPQAQIILAEEITRLVHGKSGLKTAQKITRNLFTGQIHKLTLDDFEQLFQDGIPTVPLKAGITLQQALVESKLVVSRAQARELISSNSITVNSKKQLKTEYIFCATDRLYNRFTLLRRGKKHHCLITWE